MDDPKSVVLLAIAGVLVGVMSEILVGSIEEASHQLGLSQFFVGVFVVAIVGNAAEHYVAVVVAVKDKMDLAVNIAIGSSAQIAPVRGPAAGAAVVLLRAVPDGARVQRLRARGAAGRGADRELPRLRGRVDLVRGRPAAGALRACWGSCSSSRSLLPRSAASARRRVHAAVREAVHVVAASVDASRP